jgi:hypothetical protein
MICAVRHAAAWSACLAVLALGPARAEDRFRKLDGKQITAPLACRIAQSNEACRTSRSQSLGLKQPFFRTMPKATS